jgi:hypothetical protein
MVAVIKTGHSIRRILNYNEQKVKERVAKCLFAANYAKDAEDLTFHNKLNRLLNQAALNENVTRNSVHISLNFDPSEKLSDEQLKDISETYMHKIGFGEQPYLVYQHHDAGHPHIHIVTIKVRADGSRIDMQNIGRNQSETARKEIEKLFGLLKAEDSKKRQQQGLRAVNAQRVQYGKSATKRAITNVLDVVLNTYKYASFPELNAVLKQYNVLADKGSEGSRIYENKGLVYRVLDAAGNPTGVPIKASDFYNKPTLKYLQEKFLENETAKEPHRKRVKNAIDLVFLKRVSLPFHDLIKALQKAGIDTVVRQNEEGVIYGITFVDHTSKCVFNGSALGKQYSSKALLERCSITNRINDKEAIKRPAKEQSIHITGEIEAANKMQNAVNKGALIDSPLDLITAPVYTDGYLPHQLKNNKKKKRKRSHNN